MYSFSKISIFEGAFIPNQYSTAAHSSVAPYLSLQEKLFISQMPNIEFEYPLNGHAPSTFNFWLKNLRFLRS